MIGKRGILEAAQNNQSPNGGIGRSMKVGKEEYMGMLAAVEQWVKRDHVKEWTEWERRLNVIAESVADYPAMECTFIENKQRKAADKMRDKLLKEFDAILQRELK